jgi:ATP-dependent Clp protease ATP-binding subunit ClpC
VEDPLSEALIAGNITERPAFLEVYLDNNSLFYRPITQDGGDKDDNLAGVALTTT